MTLVVGAVEAAPPDVFNSAFVVERGEIVGRYAKAHPNEPGVTAGSDFPTFARAGTRFGINICNDANHPRRRRPIGCPGRRAGPLPAQQHVASADGGALAGEELGQPDRPGSPDGVLDRVL